MRRSLILVCVGALLFAACGSSGDAADSPREVIAAVPGALQEAGSARFAGTQKVESGALSFESSTEGLFDFKSGNGQRKMTMSGVAGGEESIELRIIDLVAYTQLPELMRAPQFRGKDWVMIDLQKVGEQMGFDFAALMQASRQTETALQMLRGATDVREVGTEEVRGAETTHYSFTLDLQRVLQEVPDELKKSIQAVIDLGAGDVPGEIWIDEDGLARKMTYEMNQTIQGQEMEQRMELEYYDFGVEVEVEAPPPGDVVDLTRLGA